MSWLAHDLYRCDKCGLISSNIPPDKTMYDKSYCIKYERYARTDIGNKIDEVRLDTVLSRSDGSILDFGCGAGTFVIGCRMKGHKAQGFDINPHSGFCDITALFNGHQTVTFWDSLEHVADPKTIIKGLGARYIFISTPCTDDWPGPLPEIFNWHHYYPGEHVHYFNESSLLKLFEVCGYRVTTLHYRESEFRTSGGDKNIITIGGKKVGAHQESIGSDGA